MLARKTYPTSFAELRHFRTRAVSVMWEKNRLTTLVRDFRDTMTTHDAKPQLGGPRIFSYLGNKTCGHKGKGTEYKIEKFILAGSVHHPSRRGFPGLRTTSGEPETHDFHLPGEHGTTGHGYAIGEKMKTCTTNVSVEIDNTISRE